MKSLLKKLDMIIELLLKDREDRKAEKEARESAENEQRLIEYAKSKGKRMPPAQIHSSREAGERPMNTDGDLIPFGLSETGKAVLDEFYNGPR